MAASLAAVAWMAAVAAALSRTAGEEGKVPHASRAVPIHVVRPPARPAEPAAERPEPRPARTQAQTPLAPLELPAAVTLGDEHALGPVAISYLARPWELPAESWSVAPEAPQPTAADAGLADGSVADTPPRLLARPDLSRYYPADARRRHITGRTTVRLAIAADGTVTEVEVLRSQPAGVFDRAAREAAARLRFRPARKGGAPVAAAFILDMNWTLSDGD